MCCSFLKCEAAGKWSWCWTAVLLILLLSFSDVPCLGRLLTPYFKTNRPDSKAWLLPREITAFSQCRAWEFGGGKSWPAQAASALQGSVCFGELAAQGRGVLSHWHWQPLAWLGMCVWENGRHRQGHSLDPGPLLHQLKQERQLPA